MRKKFSLRGEKGVAYSVYAVSLTLAFFLASLFAPTATSSIAVEEEIPVFVGFIGEPQPELIKQYNGKIRVVFHIVNVISANLTRPAIEAVSKHRSVAYVEEIAMVRALQQDIPWGVERIQAPEAWEITKGAGVKVAILDTGIDVDWNGTELDIKGGVNFVGTAKDGSTDPNDWTDKDGHGTHVAGIVAALDDDDLYVGVAPEVFLYAVKVLGGGGRGTYEDLIQGIEWAVNNGMQIVSMSLGGYENSQAVNDTCKSAYNAGVLLVAASGNDGDGNATNTDPISYPAAYDSVIAVGGTDENDNVWEYSSTGPHVELSAPATNIPSLWKYPLLATASGTSMATPHVSGTAALIWAAFPTYTNDQVRKRLQETATDLDPSGRDPGYGYGLVNASKAVRAPPLGFDLNLRVMDWDLTDSIQGAYVYVDSDVKTSDVNGWANWTGVSGTAYVKVKWYGAWVNGTFSVVMDSNKTIDVRCNIFDIVVTCIEGVRDAVLQYVNVTVYNATSIASNMIRTGITGSDGKVSLANIPNSTLIFTSYDGASPQHVIANVTRTITTENQAETITCDQNYLSTSQAWGIIVNYNTFYLNLVLLLVFHPKIIRYIKCLKERVKKFAPNRIKRKEVK
jgi:subtilisin family serine protease